MPSVCVLLCVVLLSALTSVSAECQSPTSAGSSSGPAQSACAIRNTPLTNADIAFSKRKFSDAADLYRKDMTAKDAEGDRAHNGLVRTLLSDGKVSEAEIEAQTWAARNPDNSWAQASLAEVQYREGRIDETVTTMQKAGGLDRCNMQVHADFARFSELTGMYLTAKRHLDLAHTYDPLNDEIEGAWIRLQSRETQLAELNSYLVRSKFLDDKDRKALEKWKTSLEHPDEPCRLTSGVRSTVIPYHAIRAEGPTGRVAWGLLVSFNGEQRRLEIDTGASGLLLSHTAASQLHLTPEFETASWGIGDEGQVKSFEAKVQEVKIGDLKFENCYVEVLEKDSQVLEGRDGLIGGDVFSDFLLTLDFPGRQLKLAPLPADPKAAGGGDSVSAQTGSGARKVKDAYTDPSMMNWSAVFRVGHNLILPVQPNRGPMRLFIVDTGADSTLISSDAARSVTKISKDTSIQFHGISGETAYGYSTGPIELHFAGLRYPTNGLYALDLNKFGDSSGIEISGFLGAGILRRLTMTIDYRDNLVNFTYDPKRLTPCMPGVYREDCYD